MFSKFDRQILEFLHEAGDHGIKVSVLTKNVYNANCSFFDNYTIEEINKYVLSYLHRNSKNVCSLIEKMDKRGYYRLNNEVATQLMLKFTENQEEENQLENISDTDQSLSLF